MKALFHYVKDVLGAFGQDRVGQMSAAFAYIALFSIGPLLLVILSVAGFVLGQKAVEGQLFTQLSGTIGSNAAKSIQTLIIHLSQTRHNSIALIVGVVGTVLGAIGLTNQLQNSLDTIFAAVPDATAGWKHTIYTKLKNIVLLVIGSGIVVVWLAISLTIRSVSAKLHHHFALSYLNSSLLDGVVSIIIFIAVLYLIYRVFPDVRIPRRLAASAALLIGLLLLVGKQLLNFVINRNGTATAYGAAASVIVLLLWFYYTAEILLLGAEGVKVYGQHHGISFAPKPLTRKRKVFTFDLTGKTTTKIAEAFVRGYNKQK